MLSVQTTHNWAFSVDVTIGGLETYNNPATKSSAYDAITGLVAWANDAARAWFGFSTFSWSWTRDSSDGGAKLTLMASGLPFDLSAGAHTLLGLPADVGQNEIGGDQSAVGTWAPASRVAVRRHMRVLDPGDANGAGSVRPGVPGAAAFRPEVAAIGTVKEAARLAVILGTASTPRRGWVYQAHTDIWREYALGHPTRQAAGTMHYRFEFPALAVTL